MVGRLPAQKRRQPEMVDCGHHSRNGFLTVRGYAENAERERLRLLECRHVDDSPGIRYLDSMVSVSGLRRDEDMYDYFTDSQIDEQARRFLNGS